MDNTDEQLSALLNGFQINNPEIKCDGNNLIRKICINFNCKESALHCDHIECAHCYLKHVKCSSALIDGITHILRMR